MRTHSRSHNSRVALAGLGMMAALVALAGNAQPAPPADAAVADRSAGQQISEVDFTRVAQPGNACSQGMQGRPPLLVLVEGGSSEVLDDRSFTRLEVDPAVLYADLDGDGADEAVVRVVCNYGANGEQDTVQVWTLAARGPVVVDRISAAPDEVVDASAFPPGVHRVDVDGDELAVTFAVHADDDPHCCPSQQAEVRYRLDGGDLVPVGTPVTSAFVA
ncbi:MAG: LppP/LprE family lipoprotein [Acidimicrobiales bacterium]|nr:LppP/LprE family lipoprotein [Acidimicrobiales bacterium]